MIKIQAIGHLGKDALVKQVNGKNVINFSVAHTEKYKDSNDVQHEKTTWIDCSYWVDRTTVAKYLIKGTQVYIEGKPEARGFQKADGSTSGSLVVRVLNIQLLGGGQQPASQPTQATNQSAPPAFDDDLPF